MADKKTLELQIQVLMQQAQQQIKAFATDIKSAATQIKNLNANNADVKKSIESVQIEAKRAATELKTFATDGSSTISKLTKEIGTLAAVTAAVSFDKWVAGLAGSALSASTSFRAAKEDFGIMLGDMEAGAGLFAELQEFNFWTPFDLEQTSQAAKVLMAAKVPLKDITEYLTRFGDIAQGNGQRFQSFINAFSKASAKGKADMEVLNVYIDQGVQILDALGEQMGVTSAEIVNMASKGKVSFQDLDNALASLAAEGGLYYNSMATASQRLDAMQAGLKESVNALAASFGDMLAPMVAKALEIFTNLIDTINNSPFLKGVLAAALSAVVVIINTQMIRALVAFAAKIWATYAAQMSLTSALSITNPLLLAGIAAVAAATAGYVVYASTQQEAAKATEELALAQKKLNEANKNSAFDEFLSNSTLEEMKTAIENATQQLNIEKKTLEELQKQLNTGTNVFSSDFKFYVNVEERGVSQLEEKIKDSEAKIKELEEKLATAKTRLAELQNDAFNKELEDANKILERRDSLYKNTTESQRAKIKEDLEFAKSLFTLQTVNTDGTYSGFDKAKTEAIIRDLEEQMEKLTPKLGNEWQDKALEGIDKINREEEKSMEELQKKAKELLGENYENEKAYQIELAALTSYYNQKREDYNQKSRQEQIAHQKQLLDEEIKKQQEEKEQILNLHNTKIENLKKEFEYQRELIRLNLEEGTNKGILPYTKQSFFAQTSDSQYTQLINSSNVAASAMTMLSDGVLETFLQLESVQKVLNPIATVLEQVFTVIEPFVNGILKPFISIFNSLGDVIGNMLSIILGIVQALITVNPILKILEGVLKILAAAFEWLYMHVIYPVGNKIIDIINGMIDLVNKLPFVEIEKFNRLAAIGETAERIAQEMAHYEESIRQKYERQKSSVESLLQSQLDTLRTQYELGLISRQEYESQAQRYTNTADREIYNINVLMEHHLAKIEEYASEGFTAEQIQLKLSAYATGTAKVATNQIAIVHEGEAIIPKTFAQSIRNGEMTLSGKNTRADSTAIVVNVSVQGSVTTENELTDAIYNGIATGINTRKYQPLPAGV